MKRLLTFAAGLLLLAGLSFAVAQNITKAIQLSQDPSGAFGVDTVNSMYLPRHVVANDQLTPTVAAGAGAVTVTGTDFAGTIVGSGVTTTTVTLTFATAFASGTVPRCVAQSRNPATSPLAATPSTNVGFTVGSMGAATLDYICVGIRG